MRFLVLQHEEASPPALFGDWSRERGHVCEVADVPALERWPGLGGFDAVVSLGSDCSVHAGEEHWIEPELEFLRLAQNRGTPQLGICFGGQALARALGGSVRRADFVEAGWTMVRDSKSALLDEGPWFRWHEDVFSVPPGAEELARSSAGPLAFTLGRSVGLQIHPETTGSLVETWIDGARGRIGESAIDEDRLRREVMARAPGARDRAFALFDRIERFWAR